MKIEEAIKIFEDWAKCNYEPTKQAAQLALTTLRSMPEAGEYHFRDDTKMVPLSLEQLKQMDGKPVWVEDKCNPKLSAWGNVCGDACVVFHKQKYYGAYHIEDYKERWIAYSYPPAHIDRSGWISVGKRLPDSGEEVRLFCETISGFQYQCQGFYVSPDTYRNDSGYSWDDEYCEEYDEEQDDYLVNPGWYESIQNWDDYSAVAIVGKVTHWMPLPEQPDEG